MASVYCSGNASFSVEEEEQEVLQKAHDILADIRHKWHIKDDDAWDDERYWQISESVDMLENLFKCSSK